MRSKLAFAKLQLGNSPTDRTTNLSVVQLGRRGLLDPFPSNIASFCRGLTPVVDTAGTVSSRPFRGDQARLVRRQLQAFRIKLDSAIFINLRLKRNISRHDY